jgi:lipid-binding SYLF domain-containing protein
MAFHHRAAWCAAALAAGALVWTSVPAHAQATTSEVSRIQDSTSVLSDIATGPDQGIPQYLLDRAEGIVVIPDLVRGGFVVGANHGRGVISVHDRTAHTWSQPAFVEMTGGSIGWQIGVESVDLVLVLMNKDGVNSLLQDRFTIGGTASVAAGPVGRSAKAATDAQLSSEILAYSRAKGLFAGLTLEGAAVHADDSANRAFYGETSITTILSGPSNAPASGRSAVDGWTGLLQRLSVMPATTDRD